MNIYGFIRIPKGVDKNCYYHKYFIRGNSSLLHKIERVPLKNNDKSRLSLPKDPDFCSMPVVAETTTTLFNVDSPIGNSAVVANNVKCERNVHKVRNEAININAEIQKDRNPRISNEFLLETTLLSWLQSQNKFHTNRFPVSLVPMSQSLMRLKNMQSVLLHQSAMLGQNLLSLGSEMTVAPLVYQNFYDSTGISSRDYNLYNQYSTGYGPILQKFQLNSQENNKCNSVSPSLW